MTYMGSSMNPILRSGDRLGVVPYEKQEIRRGDVIVFIPPRGNTKVVHRVFSVDSNGIKTRGDNCNQPDDWPLSPNFILGRVVSAQRGNRRRRVFGGAIGQLIAVAIRTVHAIDVSVSSRFRPAYDRLAVAGVFRRWLPTETKIRVVSFDRAGGTELQLLMGRRVIGRLLPGMTRWHISRPFRLFVDEASLPENKAEVSGFRYG
jgi:signal peptidase I